MKNTIKLLITILSFVAISCTDRTNSDQEPRFYSNKNPGKWQEQEATHVIQVSRKSVGETDKIQVSVPLNTTPGHYIEAILLTDKNHKEIAKKTLMKSEIPSATFDLPSEHGGKYYVIIKCNLHDMWEQEVKPE